jgi:signal transduction histidine kinase/CheY-like chemotaxis protein
MRKPAKLPDKQKDSLLQESEMPGAPFEEMARLLELSQRLSATQDAQPVLSELLQAVVSLQHASMGVLMLYHENQHDLYTAASVGLSEEYLRVAGRTGIGQGACGRAVAEQHPVSIEDVAQEPADAPFLEHARLAGYRAIVSVPMLTQDGGPLGAIAVYFNQPHRPAEQEMRLLELYAHQAAYALENAWLYRQLQEQERRKDEFLAMLAHELRNPLAPIRNATQVMRLSSPPDPTLTWATDMVERQTHHLARLVNDLLDVSRLTQGKIELHKEPAGLTTILKRVIECSRPTMQERGHQFSVSMPAEPLWMQVDVTRIEQVFTNLLHNAAKYTEPGGQIWLSVEPQSEGAQHPYGSALVRLKDTGIGIARELLPRIFDLFTQADQSLDRTEGGLGLGLTLVRRLVEMHGGRVEVHSEGLGRGSEFLVRLPLSMPPNFLTPDILADPDYQTEEGELHAKLDHPGHRILVVDDQVDTAQSLAELLGIWGHEIRIAYDGLTALELMHAFHPDIVLLDIGLPVMNGYEVARRMRETPELADTLLVALTGYGQQEDRRHSQECGFNLHMVKPRTD